MYPCIYSSLLVDEDSREEVSWTINRKENRKKKKDWRNKICWGIWWKNRKERWLSCSILWRWLQSQYVEMYNNKENEDGKRIMKGMELWVMTYRARLSSSASRVDQRKYRICYLWCSAFAEGEIEHGWYVIRFWERITEVMIMTDLSNRCGSEVGAGIYWKAEQS
jgi:hypothetical protein